jgi:hypothetical protein
VDACEQFAVGKYSNPGMTTKRNGTCGNSENRFMNTRLSLWILIVVLGLCFFSGCQTPPEVREAKAFRKANHLEASNYKVLEPVSLEDLKYHLYVNQQRFLGLVEGIEKRKGDAHELRNYLLKVRQVSLDLLQSDPARLGVVSCFEKFLLQRFETDVLSFVAGAETVVEKPDELSRYIRDAPPRLFRDPLFAIPNEITQMLESGGWCYYFEFCDGIRLIPGFVVLRDGQIAFRYEASER